METRFAKLEQHQFISPPV